MTYAVDFGPIDLGIVDTGLSLTADIETMAGASLATGVTGWTEKPTGSGVYWGTYSSFADGASYKVLFYSGATFKTSAGVTPSDARIPVDSAAIAALAASLVTLTAYVDTEVGTTLAAVDTEIAAIKAKTDLIGTGSLAVVGSVVQTSQTGGPDEYHITIKQGADWARQLTWLDPLGAPINLTGYTARMQLRDQQNNTLLVELTTANGKIALGSAAGTITMTLTAAQTAALTWIWGVYDLELVSGGNIVTRLIAGRATVSNEVTR